MTRTSVSPEVRTYIEEAQKYWTESGECLEPARAVPLLDKAIEADPLDPAPYLLRSQALCDLGYLTDAFEAWEEEPLFLFGVTMQNHGGYDVPGFESTVTLTGQAYPDAEQYLSLLRETDRAVEYLIRYFESVEEEVVVVFFGDHQPKLDESFFRTLGNEEETLEDRQKRYQVPFFIWANYDIPEQEGILTSLNYLSNYAYEAAGLPLPAYNRFLAEMAEHIPAINSQGFYSNASGCYLTFEEASVEEQRWLADYRLLQYNSLWDTDNRSDRLFPLPPKS